MTDLGEATTSLANTIARPGTFATLFSETTDNDLVDVLRDGFAECQMEGMFSDYTDTDGVIDPDLTNGETATVVLFAAVRLLRAELANRASHVRYEAGPVTFEEDRSAQVLRQVFDDMRAQKARMTNLLSETGNAGSVFLLADAYVARTVEDGASVYAPDEFGII